MLFRISRHRNETALQKSPTQSTALYYEPTLSLMLAAPSLFLSKELNPFSQLLFLERQQASEWSWGQQSSGMSLQCRVCSQSSCDGGCAKGFCQNWLLKQFVLSKMLRYGLLATEGIWESRNAGLGSFCVSESRGVMTLKLTGFYWLLLDLWMNI